MRLRISNLSVAFLWAAFFFVILGFAQGPGKIVTAIRPNNIWSLYQYDINGSGPDRLSFTPPNVNMQINYDLSADGRRVAFEFSNNIWVMYSNGKGLRQLTATNNNSKAAISRDGSLIAFTSSRNNNTDIYVVKWDGTDLRRLTTNAGIDQRPAFSPDGTKIVFDTNRFSPQFGLPNLMLINTDGTNETRLTFFFEFGGRFSPDGSTIVYQGRAEADQNNFNDIFVYNLGGGTSGQLTDNDVQEENPSFSLDGTKIAFERSVVTPSGATRDHIFVMDANGSNVQQVTFPDAINENREVPRWIPLNHLATRARAADFDGEGSSDLAVFRATTGEWFRKNSQVETFSGQPWGLTSDKLAPADYDRDAVIDYAVFRDGAWWILGSTDGTVRSEHFGTAGDIPMPGDYDADGFADIAVFRPSTGTWWRINSSNDQIVGIQFGQNGDVPMAGDYDGDAMRDLTVFRPSNSVWYVYRSSTFQVSADAFGTPGDIPISGDFNGDGRSDLAVYRPSNGTWYIARPAGVPSQNFNATSFGIATDKPVAADYDSDGKTDIAVFRDGTWWILRSSTGQIVSEQFGLANDKPVVAP